MTFFKSSSVIFPSLSKSNLLMIELGNVTKLYLDLKNAYNLFSSIFCFIPKLLFTLFNLTIKIYKSFPHSSFKNFIKISKHLYQVLVV